MGTATWTPLKDEDRIFTNLYGYDSWRLEAAKKLANLVHQKKI